MTSCSCPVSLLIVSHKLVEITDFFVQGLLLCVVGFAHC